MQAKEADDKKAASNKIRGDVYHVTFRKAVVALALCALSTNALAQTTDSPEAKDIGTPKLTIVRNASSGIDVSAIDLSVRPQDDFYRYVNGHWLDTTPIPADRSRYGMFDLLNDRTVTQLKSIIDEAQLKDGQEPDLLKLGDMYKSFMNVDLIDKLSFKPLQADLKYIAGLKKNAEVGSAFGKLRRIGVKTPLGFFVYPDSKNPETYGFWLEQSGITLPDRDYYLKDEAKFIAARKALQDYAASLFSSIGYPQPQQAAARILALETEIARIQMSKVESRDDEKNYNPRSAQQVEELLQGLGWHSYAEALGCQEVQNIIVQNLPYFEKLGALVASTDTATWRDYLSFHLLDDYAPFLSSDFVKLAFQFHGTALKGTPENLPRWKRAIDLTSSSLGELLGKQYVKHYFSSKAKERMQDMIANLVAAYGESIRELSWMSEETKEKALEKLKLFKPKVGYPDKWRDYSELIVKDDDLVGNLKRSSQFELSYDLKRAGKPIDPVDWGMTPQTVNAYYSPTRNEIVFPAAILQPPFFNLEADDAVNYGGIGGVIGHEIGHGFDDQGSKYDGNGYLRNWWTQDDRKAFDALGDRLCAQYDTYSPIKGMHVNGKLTLGENIGDLAGVAVGYKAYLRSLKGEEAPVIDGLTGEQRFFMGWAQVWRSKIREDAMRARLLSDPHSPPQYRVYGPLRQVDAFYKAFEVKEGDAMFLAPKDRVKIW